LQDSRDAAVVAVPAYRVVADKCVVAVPGDPSSLGDLAVQLRIKRVWHQVFAVKGEILPPGVPDEDIARLLDKGSIVRVEAGEETP